MSQVTIRNVSVTEVSGHKELAVYTRYSVTQYPEYSQLEEKSSAQWRRHLRVVRVVLSAK